MYVAGLLVLSARPVYRYYAHLMGHGPPADYWLAALNVGGLSALIVLASFLLAAQRLKKLEIG
jgi:hypothetical protein